MPDSKAVVQLTEFSNGPSLANGSATGECEYVELYVTKCSLYPEATEVDIRGWIVDDNANNFNSGGGCTGNILTTAGHLRFADSPTWESVPVGSIIVLYNTVDNASCFNFTADLTGSGGVYYIPVGSTGLIEASSNAPTSSSCDYCTATYASYNPWWGIVTDTDRDAIQVRCPGCGEGDGGPAFYQGLSWGLTDMGPIAPGSNDLGGAHMHMGGRGRTFILDTDDVEDIKAGLGWTSTTAVASRPTAGSVSAGLRAALLGSPLPCCGNFEPPVVAEKQQYRYGFGGQMKDDEVYGATGTSYTAEFWQYDPRTGRRWNLDPVFKPWQSSYSVFSDNPIARIDPKGDDDYFNADGTFSHRTKTGHTILIKTDAGNVKFSAMRTNDMHNRQVMANVVAHYAQQVGINGTVGISNHRSKNARGANATLAFTTGNNIYVNARGGGVNSLLDDYRNMESTLAHERIHKERGEGFANPDADPAFESYRHAQVYLAQMQDPTFKDAPFKSEMMGSVVSYLNKAVGEMKQDYDPANALSGLISDFNKLSDVTGYKLNMSVSGIGSNPDMYTYKVSATQITQSKSKKQ